MSKITGYARQDEPKWLYFGLGLLLLAVVSVLYLGGKAVYRWAESGSAARLRAAEQKPAEVKIPEPAAELKTALGPAGELGEITVERIVFTSGLDAANRPTDDLSEISPAAHNTLYCCTRIRSAKLPQTVKHVWLRPDGRVAADIELNLARQTVDTYSYISLYGAVKGTWQMEVRNGRDEVVARKTFKLT